MAGRSHRAKGRVAVAGTQLVDSGEARAGGETGGVEACRARIRVGIQASAAAIADCLDPVEVPLGMHPQQVFALGRTGLELCHRLIEIGAADACEHGVESLGPFGMTRSGEVFEIHRMSGEQHGHAVGRYLATARAGLPFGP